jgi:hypothetical protein
MQENYGLERKGISAQAANAFNISSSVLIKEIAAEQSSGALSLQWQSQVAVQVRRPAVPSARGEVRMTAVRDDAGGGPDESDIAVIAVSASYPSLQALVRLQQVLRNDYWLKSRSSGARNDAGADLQLTEERCTLCDGQVREWR